MWHTLTKLQNLVVMKGKSFKDLMEVILNPFLTIFVPFLYVVLVSK